MGERQRPRRAQGALGQNGLASVVIRADASASIGAGHAMRCLALAQAWIDRGADVHWLAAELLPSCGNLIAAEGIHVALQCKDAPEEEDAARTEQFAAAVAADWVVLDGYSFGALHQATLKQAGRRVLFIDDYSHADEYTADIVLNQNIYADETLVSEKDRGAMYLLGPRNALLRREFRDADSGRETPTQALNLLVIFGGVGDAAQASLIVEALRRLAPRRTFQVRLVLGSAVRSEDIVDGRTEGWLTVSQFVGDMPAALACADMAVSAAGSTVYELMKAGVPSLVVAVAENQRAVARKLSQLGIGINLGFAGFLDIDSVAEALDSLAADARTRASMSAKGRETVDGQGALRVQAVMEAGLIHLRNARVDDMRMIWHWANDAAVRAVSFSDRADFLGGPRALVWRASSRPTASDVDRRGSWWCSGGRCSDGVGRRARGDFGQHRSRLTRRRVRSMADPAGESGHPSRCRCEGCPCLHQA